MQIKLIYILVFALMIRVLANIPGFNNSSLAIHNDSYLHLNIASNIIAGNGFSACNSKPFYKSTIITPGYPYLLAGLQKVFGKDLRYIIGVQILLDLIICYLLFLIGKSLFTRKVALGSVVLYALSSHAITFSGLVITETLFTLVLLLSIYFSFCTHSKYRFLILALLFACLVLIRPIAIYLLPIFGLLSIKNTKRNQILKGISTVIVGFLLVFVWVKRNHTITGIYTVSAIQEYNLYFTFANAIKAKKWERHENDQRDIFVNGMENKPLKECNGDYRYILESKNKGLEILKANMLEYLALHVTSIPNMFLPEITLLSEKWGLSTGGKGTLGIINREGILAGFKHYYGQSKIAFIVMLPFVVIWIFTLMFFVLGIVKLTKEQFLAGCRLLLVITLYFVVIPGPAGNGRFLMPVIPFICLIAASGLSKLRIIKMYD